MHDRRGFITLEILTAIALIGATLTAALMVTRGNAYWIMSARASGEDMLTAATQLAATRALAAEDFFRLGSAWMRNDAACSPAETCDGVRRTAVDVSSCAKNIDIRTERHFPGYPTRFTALSSVMTDPAEFAALGSDCSLEAPTGAWNAPNASTSFALGSGNLTGLDVLDGTTYVTADVPPYLRIVTREGGVIAPDTSLGTGPFTAIDVARDMRTGRIYAYVGAVSPQLQIIDVTDPTASQVVGSASLAGVSLKGAQAEAWRVTVYGGVAYVAARYMIAANPELHIFDVTDPASPHEIGGGYKVSTSIYGMIAHERAAADAASGRKRYLYLATTAPAGELKVLDVTDPRQITSVAACDLLGNYQATALALLGSTLFVGRDNVPNGGEDLYAFEASDPASPSFCVPTAKTDINTDGFSRHVQALRASGPFLFVATSNTTNAHGQIQIRSANPADRLAVIGTYAAPSLDENALDVEANVLYAAGAVSPQLLTITSP